MRKPTGIYLLAVVPCVAGFENKLQIPLSIPATTSHASSCDDGLPFHASGALNSAASAVSYSVSKDDSYWLENIQHRGIAAFNPVSTYQVFRNVKDFGAKGDGVTDDTAAINLAISSGNRCAPGKCESSTITPAVVYFPAGNYSISSSIIDYYYTQIIGNPNDLPILRATAGFTGFGVIDGNQYQAGGVLGFGSTNVFFRQIRNLIIDLTAIPASKSATGIHWPTSQATSLQNIIFYMSDALGTQHQGLFVESGSAGFVNDLIFYGGLAGAVLGNQQYTMRNLSFYNAVTAINQLWSWGWTYQSITIQNCSVGLDLTSGGHDAQAIGSVTIVDSYFKDTPLAFNTSHDASSSPAAGGSLILENIKVENVPIIVKRPGGVTALQGSTGVLTVPAWGQGHSYAPNGPKDFQGPINPPTRPASLLSGNAYYQRSKPQYADLAVSQVISARSKGARGDGIADDTAILQQLLLSAVKTKSLVFFDAGTYKVTNTLYVPPGSRIVGESYSVILSSGNHFEDLTAPKPVVKVGHAGEKGIVEWSDMIVSTQGPQAGAILIEWNLASTGAPSGMWDVHTRIGGFAGSELQVAQCPTTPKTHITPAAVNKLCIGAYMSMYVSRSAANLYLENVWLWSADHDLDDPTSTQITVYSGRGLLIDGSAGKIWLVGTGVEHHVFYQYQFANTHSIFAGQIQTETPYYQPNPNATVPFPIVRRLQDPNFPASCAGQSGNCATAWGLRIINSNNISIYGAGLYSFFDNYNTSCSAAGNGEVCQSEIFSLEGTALKDIHIYNLNTIGATSMINKDRQSLASYADNVNVFPDTIALFYSN